MDKLNIVKFNLLNDYLQNPDLFLFDTHCHLSDSSYSDEEFLFILNMFIKKKKQNFKILNVGCDMISNIKTINQSKCFPESIYASIGFHPNSNYDLEDQNIIWLEKQIKINKIIAIGEIGLDYYRSFTEIEKQKKFLIKQILIAKMYNLPILLHLRTYDNRKDVFYDAISILKEIGWYRGVVHCFSGDYSVAKEFISLGFYISFSGMITFKKENILLKELINNVPENKILLETDSPYLSPSPLRGRKNFPWNIIYTLKLISEIKKKDFNEISKITFSNSFSLFFK